MDAMYELPSRDDVEGVTVTGEAVEDGIDLTFVLTGGADERPA